MPIAPDHLELEAFSPLGGAALQLLDLADPGAEAAARFLAARSQAVILGLDAVGNCPGIDPAPFDALLTTAADAPSPWVSVPPARFAARLADIRGNAAAAPIAAAVLCRVLKVAEQLPLRDGLAIESLAYSTLLAGAEFDAWRTRNAASPAAPPGHFVSVERSENTVMITLTRPDTRNAMSAGMRDGLWEALANVLDDPSDPELHLRGAGSCFSTGGELGEFGTAQDLAQAHTIRIARSCAALLAQLGQRATVTLHGACIGSGLEIPAAAAHRLALPGTFFQLPELRMGLLPGAGGTVTLSNVIGRHRTAYMALSARRIAMPEAVAWGLVREPRA